MALKLLINHFRKDEILPISSELKITDFHGNNHILKALVGPIIPIPLINKTGNQSILVQSMGNFELDGISGDFGSFETLRRV